MANTQLQKVIKLVIYIALASILFYLILKFMKMFGA
jgi:hypothetical protein